jgi:protease-4
VRVQGQDAARSVEAPPSPQEKEVAPQAKPSDTKPSDTKTSDTKTPDGTANGATRGNPGKTEKKKEDPKVKIHRIALSGSYVDLDEAMPLDATSLLLGSGPMKRKSFYRLCDYLDELAKDSSLTYVVFDLSDPMLGLNIPQLEELSRRIERLNQSGKKTIAWLETANNVHVAVAAACKQVLQADFGTIDIPSTSMESIFYRDAMDLLGIKASVVRAGDFKGAVEPYVNSVMSDHLREHYRSMLRSINDAMVGLIAKGRNLTVAKARQLQEQRVLLPQQALDGGLVDRLVPYGGMQKAIDEMVGKPTQWTEPQAKPKREMSFFELMGKIMAGPKTGKERTKEKSIAVMHLSGAIEDGKKAVPGSVVSGPIVKSIEELAQDDLVQGVVVRINSPGGSATASEAIRQALQALANKKPTVVSMGDVAASGGYWVACIGQPIYAERSTITGSIGVFTMKLSFGNLMRRVGLHVETIALDPAASAFSMERAWTEKDEKLFQPMVDQVYDRFLKLVQQSRSIPIAKLAGLAGGRVWSGAQAKENGLVDAIGGLDDCLAVVAKKANLDSYKVIHRPVPSSGLDLLELLGESESEEIGIGANHAEVWRQLQRQGFRLWALRAILRDAMQGASNAPTIWALDSAEIRLR